MPQSKLFTYWNSLEEKDLPPLKDEDGRKFFLDTWKAIKQAEAYSAAGKKAEAHQVMNDRIWAIENKELPALAKATGENAAGVRAYLAETAALYRAGRLAGAQAGMIPSTTGQAGRNMPLKAYTKPLTSPKELSHNESGTPVRGDWIIGPKDSPWLVFNEKDAVDGLQVGAAAVGSSFSMGIWDGGKYREDPSFAGSKILADIGREAGLLAVGLAAKGFTVAAHTYQKAGGGGITLIKNGKRIFGLDFHKFKNLSARLHVHVGETIKQMEKHRPYDGGMERLKAECIAFLKREAPDLSQAVGPAVTAEVVEWFVEQYRNGG